jgi:predicted lipoprotein with Yx(FWY)xxD motif
MALGLLLAACSGSGTESTTTTSAQTTTTAAETTTTVQSPQSAIAQSVAIGASDLGDILVDGDGNTLYLFSPDAQGPSTCYDACEANWPPLVGDISAGAGIDTALLGTATRDDGTVQVTYNGWPLYYFANDAAAGDTNGQGINGVWYVVSGSGDPVEG